MPETRIDAAVASGLTTAVDDYSVATETTDAASEVGETRWENRDWTQWLGYYKSIPELRAVTDCKATWTVGKGVLADEVTTMLLDTIKGWGKDTFNTILENCIRTYNIGGDSFCEIIRDDEDNLINLKPLDPSTIVIIANAQGLIIRYEQNSKIRGKELKTINPENMFHLARNRVADEIHGQSITGVLANIILMKNEAMTNNKEVMNRYMKPRYIFHLDTDNDTEIAAFKVKMDKAWNDGENVYVPKDVIVPEVMSIAPNATLNPLSWIESLDEKFYEAAQVPKIIVGGIGAITEAAVKIAYLAFEQTIREEQLFVEEQILSQLNLVLELQFPASLENELISDSNKDVESGATQPNDTEAGSER